jgi:hypothetical protein
MSSKKHSLVQILQKSHINRAIKAANTKTEKHTSMTECLSKREYSQQKNDLKQRTPLPTAKKHLSNQSIFVSKLVERAVTEGYRDQ